MEISDEQLIDKFQQLGDIDALNVLVNRYLKKTYCYFLRQISNRDDAEDLSQNVFLNIIRNINNGKNINKFREYLFRSCRNLCLDYFRQKKAGAVCQTKEDNLIVHENDQISFRSWNPSSPTLTITTTEVENTIHHCIEKFSNKNVQAILLDYVYGYSLKEIAERNNCPESTAGSIWHRQKSKLIKCVVGVLTLG